MIELQVPPNAGAYSPGSSPRSSKGKGKGKGAKGKGKGKAGKGAGASATYGADAYAMYHGYEGYA